MNWVALSFGILIFISLESLFLLKTNFTPTSFTTGTISALVLGIFMWFVWELGVQILSKHRKCAECGDMFRSGEEVRIRYFATNARILLMLGMHRTDRKSPIGFLVRGLWISMFGVYDFIIIN